MKYSSLCCNMIRYVLFVMFSFLGYIYCVSHQNNEILISIPENTVIDSIVVIKSKRTLIVYSEKKEIKTYQVALGRNPVGKKRFEGDLKTPEGLYYIDAKSSTSNFHKNMNVSYPNTEDIKYAATQHKSAGGDIKIHGLPNGYKEEDYEISDWTLGCIAVTNTEIDELFEHVKLGCPILILP